MHSLKQLITEKRKTLRLTQSDLADQTGLSIRTIQRIEAGKVAPQNHTLKQIIATLNLDDSEIKTEQVFIERTEERTFSKFMIKLSAITSLLIPLNLLILFSVSFWKKSELVKDPEARKVLRFQIIWSSLQILTVFLVPVFSFLITGQKSNGQSILPQLTYLVMTLLNLLILSIAHKEMNKGKVEVLENFPFV